MTLEHTPECSHHYDPNTPRCDCGADARREAWNAAVEACVDRLIRFCGGHQDKFDTTDEFSAFITVFVHASNDLKELKR